MTKRRMDARFTTRGVPGKGSVELRITWVTNAGIPSKDDGAEKVLVVEIEAKEQDLPEPATWAA